MLLNVLNRVFLSTSGSPHAEYVTVFGAGFLVAFKMIYFECFYCASVIRAHVPHNLDIRHDLLSALCSFNANLGLARRQTFIT